VGSLPKSWWMSFGQSDNGEEQGGGPGIANG